MKTYKNNFLIERDTKWEKEDLYSAAEFNKKNVEQEI